MNQYFLPKSGWDFFDVSRAYGLGIVVHTLSEEATVSDVGGFYLVESSKNVNFSRIDEINKWLPEDDNAWNQTFLTIGEKLERRKKMRVKEYLNDVKNIKDLINVLYQPKPPSVVGKGKETLYQSMDLAATKGFREEIPKTYSEGSNIKISSEDFCLSVLGHLNAGIRKFSNKIAIFILPTPNKTKISHLNEIRKKINDSVKTLHKAGWFTSLSQIAVNLVLEELEIEKGSKFSPKFGSLIYGVMTKTGNQWKPLAGGIFPLDFLYQIADSEFARDLLNKWRDLFNRTSFREGYENLASSLAEFIANPSLVNYERYIRLHLRNELSKDRIKFGVYEEKILKEVMDFVGV
ncbi:MAG: hypothetical protein QXV35_05140 [Archaeoglobaceae archaeon]